MAESRFAGMTVNERLFDAGLTALFEEAVMQRDREGMIAILAKVDLVGEQADWTIDAMLGKPAT